jgi:benzoyl-CoA reductase/2-hydroxyglutaryl-CoA dehydratase subunit BcrC/BadD/HgdB
MTQEMIKKLTEIEDLYNNGKINAYMKCILQIASGIEEYEEKIGHKISYEELRDICLSQNKTWKMTIL